MPNKHIPAIRFNGFRDEWEKAKINKVFNISRGASPRPIKKYITSGDGVNWIKIGDVLSSSKYIEQTNEKITFDGAEKSKYIVPGDILLSNSMSYGRPYISKIHGCIHDGWLLLNPIVKLSKDFFIEYLSTDKIQKEYKKYAAGSTVNNLNIEIVNQVSVCSPNLLEQQKIGSLFSTLDTVIEHHQQLLDTTKAYKTAMLQHMFPKAGETTPAIRFKGFTDEWEKCALTLSISSEEKGKIKLDHLNPGETEYLDSQRLNGESVLHVEAEKNVEKNDIIILWDGSNAGRVYHGFEGVLGSTLKVYKINDDFDDRFIFQYLKYQERLIFTKYRTPNIPHVIKDFSSVFQIFKTSYEEQKAVGDFFHKLDDKIALYEKKLDLYKQLKKSLLQQMFV